MHSQPRYILGFRKRCSLPQPLSHQMTLEESLNEVLEIPLGESDGRSYSQLTLTRLGDRNIFSQLTSLAVHFDVIDQKLFESSRVELFIRTQQVSHGSNVVEKNVSRN